MRSIPAGDVEQAVMIQLKRIFQAPEIIGETVERVRAKERDEREKLERKRGDLTREVNTLRANAAKMVSQTGFPGRPGRVGPGGSFIAEELARMEGQVEILEKELEGVNSDLEAILSIQPTTPMDLTAELATLSSLWDELFPKEKERIISLLIDKVVVTAHGIDLAIRADGLQSIKAELTGREGINHARQ